jgi:hypothetical protein
MYNTTIIEATFIHRPGFIVSGYKAPLVVTVELHVAILIIIEFVLVVNELVSDVNYSHQDNECHNPVWNPYGFSSFEVLHFYTINLKERAELLAPWLEHVECATLPCCFDGVFICSQMIYELNIIVLEEESLVEDLLVTPCVTETLINILNP